MKLIFDSQIRPYSYRAIYCPKIEIDFTSEQLVDDLIAVLTKVERLLMLLMVTL